MNILKTIINEIAKTDITVLIKGESGAEKEFLDRTIHLNSKNAAERAEKEAIQEVLQKTCWNRKETAKLLHVSYKALLYKIQKYHLNEWRGLKRVEYRTC